MDSEAIWRYIDEQRSDLADLLDTLTPDQWAAGSLCAGWSVRDVAAHLTHGHLGTLDLLGAAVRSGFRFDAMTNRLVVADGRAPEEVTAQLRAMVGSRRRPPTPTPLDPLMDVLVHGQDIAVPLGIDRQMPGPAAVAVAARLWHMRFPLNPQRSLPRVRLIAADADFAVGDGGPVRAPIRELVMVLAGRRALSSVSAGAGPA
ncbi:MAG: maleylpyruvate isomerase family mycothiol-dependent enzyme [Mycobacterium sp.]